MQGQKGPALESRGILAFQAQLNVPYFHAISSLLEESKSSLCAHQPSSFW
jgi:hypothetical protein